MYLVSDSTGKVREIIPVLASYRYVVTSRILETIIKVISN
jgi:hypothetical protein